MAMRAIAATPLLPTPASDSPIGELAPGDGFDALDFSANSAWGIATKHGLVGYVDRAAIDFAEPRESMA